MELLIFRHGPAGDRAKWKGDDAERPLCDLNKTKKAAKKLPKVKVIATSPLLRALQTAKILKKTQPKAKLVIAPELSPEAVPQYAVDLAAQMGDGACLVGHEPQLSEIIKLITGGACKLKKAGAAMIDWDGKKGHLVWLATPAMLRALD